MTCRIIYSGFLFCVMLNTQILAAGTKMSVQVRDAKVKAEPAPFSRVIGSATLADQVTIIGEKGTWSKVRLSSGVTGWLPTSSLTRKKLKLQAADASTKTSASSGEMALATKGFNPQVEEAFKKNNKDISFEWVDKMEKDKFSLKEIKKFLKKGEVEPRGGE